MKPRILLVDDDPITLVCVAQALELEELEVVQAQSGNAAVRLLGADRYDLIVTDLIMEVPNGLDLLKLTKEHYPETAVIILTGFGDVRPAIEALRLGADDYLLKPCETDELVFRIKSCIHRSELKRSNNELERRIDERTEQLRAMNETLKEEIRRHERAKVLLGQSLSEKELLLREVQHRIKNNLATITALINLEGVYPAKRSLSDSLSTLLQRVRAIYLVYEQASREQKVSSRGYRAYVDTLVGDILQLAGRSSDDIAMEIDIDEITLDLDTAIPLGLVLRELVSNSLSHGLSTAASGGVSIRLRALPEPSEYELIVADTGRGFPPDFAPSGSATLGYQLIASLAEQLGGILETSNDGGARVSLRFPMAAPQAAV